MVNQIKKITLLSLTVSSLIFTPLFGANSSYPNNLKVFDGKLYFGASDGVHGVELWVSDGTKNGTNMIKDIYIATEPMLIQAGFKDSNPSGFTAFNGKLYFNANDATYGKELWVTDGTETGTKMVKDIYTGSISYGPFSMPNDSDPSYLTAFNGKLYFNADDGIHGEELWVSDGTEDGTQILKDIRSGDGDSSPKNFAIFNNKLYFSANDGVNGNELWESNGSADGTKIFKDISSNSNPSSFTEFNGKLYFNATTDTTGVELWESNGSADGTQMVKDIALGLDSYNNPQSSNPSGFIVFNEKLYFRAKTDTTGVELWESNGSADGTQMVKDIRLGVDGNGKAKSSAPSGFIIFDNKLFFSAKDNIYGTELWESNGSADGTKIYKNIYEDNQSTSTINNSSPSSLTIFNGKLYFNADDGFHGQELWSYDGLNEPKIFKDISFDNTKPTVTNVTISGTIDVGKVVTGSYNYSDIDNQIETNSTYQWYRSDDTNGTNIEAISNATSKTYTITTLDSEKYLLFSVTPNDGMDSGDEVNSSYSSQVPIKIDFNSITTLNKWSMISVPDERNVSVSDLSGVIIWTYNNNTNQWEIPSTLTAGKGYILYTSSNIGVIPAIKTSSITNDYTTIKNAVNNEWTLIGVSKSINGIEWSDIYNPDNTLKTNCDYTQIFYYDTINDSWNSTLKVPYLGAIWVKQNCQAL